VLADRLDGRPRVAPFEEQGPGRTDHGSTGEPGAGLIALDGLRHESIVLLSIRDINYQTEGASEMSTSSVQGIRTVLHPVSDVDQAKAVYTALLGVEPQTDSPYYVGYDVAGQHIGLVPGGGPQGLTSPVAYWHVDDIEAKLAEVTAAGATIKDPAGEVGGGRIVASVVDPDGNVLGLIQDQS
jgi:predicted enzyme related to lactoylglutathione lyase